MEKNSLLGLIQKAYDIWAHQYHYRIPLSMLHRYYTKFKQEHDAIKKYGKRYFDPNNTNDYHAWLSYISVPQNTSNIRYTTICPTKTLDISTVDTPYIAINNNVTIYHDYLPNTQHDVIYFDSDEIKDNIRCHPHLKPDYSPNTLLHCNYIGDYWLCKKELLLPYQNQPWDPYLWLREISDKTNDFYHVPYITYGTSSHTLAYHKPNYQLTSYPLVSIIIPTKDKTDILDTCLQSIYQKTTYPNYEIIIVDNNSSFQETFTYFNTFTSTHPNTRIHTVKGPFNFSYINNEAVKVSKGEYLLFLNNDTSIITPNWIEEMVTYAKMKDNGAVGVMLYYPDDAIQHAGVIAGKGGAFAHRYYKKDNNITPYDYTLRVPEDISCVTAACMMVSKKKFAEVKGFNESLEVQFNDCDVCLKLLEKGYHNVFLPHVHLYHYESKSRGIDRNKASVQRFNKEVDYVQTVWKKYLTHDPYYNDNLTKNYDYMLQVPDKIVLNDPFEDKMMKN